ncbi:MAG: adenylyltransferase/cytidyltransferase family protein [bacterium]|nr:adenylyltransferase/cytidyltransferase family protein [bacterium]
MNTKKNSNGVNKKTNKEIIVAASGYFDPIHTGHIEYLKLAKKLGDKLVVIVNNDDQAKMKKGYVFMSCDERKKIVGSLKYVDEVFESIDRDGSVCRSIEKIMPDIFAKGGDRNLGNIPEKGLCQKYGIKMIDKLGKKIQSSSNLVKNESEIIKRMNTDKKIKGMMGKIKVVKKPWGKEEWVAHNKLYTGKIISIDPWQKLSEQYHNMKHETIYVLEGKLKVGIGSKETILEAGKSIVILPKTVHRFSAGKDAVKLFEISTSEVEDVIRLSDSYGRIK